MEVRYVGLRKTRILTASAARRRILCCLLILTMMAAALPARAATAIYTVTASKVNVRSAPDADAEIITVVRQGSEMTFLSDGQDGWIKVLVGGKEGYVSAEYARLSTVITGAGTLTGVVTTDKLNLRAEPSSSGKSLDMLRKGTTLTIVSKNGDWYQVNYNGTSGYVAAAYIRMTAATVQSENPIVPVVTQPYITPAPTVAPTPAPVYTTTLKEGSKGTEVKELQVKLINLGYLKASADGIYGSTTKRAVRSFQSANGLKVDGIAGPATRSAIDAAASKLSPSQIITVTGVILKSGSSGDAVRTLQNNLIRLGYLTGSADGKFGTGTKNAVRAFQAANGLTADGEAGEKTLAAIQAAVSAVTSAATLQEGSRGDAVRALQQKLISLGCMTSSADGIYGTSTKAAVQKFQTQKGMTATGAADAATISAIDQAYQSGAIGTGTITAPSPVQQPTTVISPSQSDLAKYPTLKYGDTGSYVITLQTRLKALNYFTGSIGGNFGTLTQKAVSAFQSANGLTADGVVGQSTWSALFAKNAGTAASTTLKLGDKGDEVSAMQARLKELGYLSGNVDGDFGAKTMMAVQAFQTKMGYTADGIAGPQLLTALYSPSALKATDIGANGVVPGNPNFGESDVKVIRDTNYAVAEQMTAMAKQYLGCKYIYAHQSPPYFDCSGLTYYIYKQFGYTLKRTAYAQGYDDTWPKIEKISDLQIGDLIYFNTNETDEDLCDHAAIYLGDGTFIHASSSAGKVVINNLTSGYYYNHFSWGRRVLNN